MLRAMAFAGTALVVAAALVAVACSRGGGDNGGQATDADLTRTGEADGVSVDATWLTAEALDGVQADLSAYPLSGFALVEIAFTTHSGDLNRIEMERAAGLSRGGAAERPVAWVSLSDDSHHRTGVLVFPRAATDGPAVVTIDLGEESVALVWQSVPNT